MKSNTIVNVVYVNKTYTELQKKQQSGQYIKKWAARLTVNHHNDYLQNIEKWVKWIINHQDWYTVLHV